MCACVCMCVYIYVSSTMTRSSGSKYCHQLAIKKSNFKVFFFFLNFRACCSCKQKIILCNSCHFF